MIPKKGANETKMVAFIILALIGLIVIIWILIAMRDVPLENFGDYTCFFSNRMKALLPGKLKCVAPGTAQPLRFCKMQQVNIVPNNWKECEFEELSGINSALAVRNCTMQQILDLTLNCWKMGGAGKYHSCSFMCDLATITTDRSEDISDIGSINDRAELRAIHKKDIEYELGCRPNQQAEERVIDEEITGCDCTSVTNSLTDNFESLTTYNALVAYFGELVANNVSNTGGGSEGFLVYCAKDGVAAEPLKEQLFDMTSFSSSAVSGIITSSINTSKSGCENAVEEIYQALLKRREYAEKSSSESEEVAIILDKCITSGDAAESVTGAENAASFFESKKERIDLLMNTTKEITSSVPTIESISEADLWEFAEQTIDSKSGNTYAREFRGDAGRMQFIGEYKIGVGAVFEVAFCDASKLGSGFVSSSNCGFFDKTQVQIGIQGAGAGGLSRTGSPYCRMATIIDPLGTIATFGQVEKPITGFCKGAFWRSRIPTQ